MDSGWWPEDTFEALLTIPDSAEASPLEDDDEEDLSSPWSIPELDPADPDPLDRLSIEGVGEETETDPPLAADTSEVEGGDEDAREESVGSDGGSILSSIGEAFGAGTSRSTKLA